MKLVSRKGFTLIEILIVVIILGILAAIVIPQFTNASQDAQKASCASQLQTIRSAVELYKLQHGDNYPTTTGQPDTNGLNWTLLVGKTTGSDGRQYGPYLQNTPGNPMNTNSTSFASGGGWIMDGTTGIITATSGASGTMPF
jgi:general secretion pathway protein G